MIEFKHVTKIYRSSSRDTTVTVTERMNPYETPMSERDPNKLKLRRDRLVEPIEKVAHERGHIAGVGRRVRRVQYFDRLAPILTGTRIPFPIDRVESVDRAFMKFANERLSNFPFADILSRPTQRGDQILYFTVRLAREESWRVR